MQPVHVLISAKVTAEQLARMRGLHPRLIIHGEPGGFAIMHASEVDYKGIDYPDERPDVDVETLVGQAEAIIATRIPNNLLDRAHRLRWLQFTSAGVDHLWKPSLDAGTVIVTSAKSIHGTPISEFVMGCMLFFAKGMARMQQQQRERIYKKFLIEELFAKTSCSSALASWEVRSRGGRKHLG
jgi:phosphoglycerate dehydrogenase-like enzyme